MKLVISNTFNVD